MCWLGLCFKMKRAADMIVNNSTKFIWGINQARPADATINLAGCAFLLMIVVVKPAQQYFWHVQTHK